MHPIITIATLGAIFPGLAVGQSLVETSINNAQASALAGPISSYMGRVEASQSFAKVVAEIAQATAYPNLLLTEGAPSAANFPAFAQALNAVAAKDTTVVGSLPTDAQQFLADAAHGEIAVIQSVLSQGGASNEATGTGYAFSAIPTAAVTVASASGVIPTNWAGSNATQPNASTIVAPIPTAAATHVSTGGATMATTVGASVFGLMVALWTALA